MNDIDGRWMMTITRATVVRSLWFERFTVIGSTPRTARRPIARTSRRLIDICKTHFMT